MKKVEVTYSNFFNVGPGISTIYVYEGKEFPSDWSWLRKFLTNWTLVGKELVRGQPTIRYLRDRYGEAAIIKTYY